jgi:CO/xanthine dehydrogenase Mo-binding subunit
VFDVEEAFKKNPPAVVHPDLPHYKAVTGLPIRRDPERPNVPQTFKIRSGNVDRGFEEADLIVENRFTTARIQHCQLEPHSADAWFESDGGLTIRTSIQAPWVLKLHMAELFNLPPASVRVLSSYIGGAFGGKGWIRTEAIAALLARKSRRPVRLIFSREEMFTFGGNRVPFTIDIKDGVKSDGTILAREIRMLLALGLYSEIGVLLVKRAAAGAVGTYRIPNFKLDSWGVYTNMPLTGPFRGFGSIEIQWPIEQQMDIIAEKLGIDPAELRKKNVLNEGDKDVSGMVTHSIGVRECLDEAVRWIGWNEKPAAEQGPWKRGKGIAIGNKSVKTGDTSVVNVKVCEHGRIEVRNSAAQVGQGIKTALTQIAAEQFGVSPDRISMVSGDTAFCPYDEGAIASRSLVHNGNALIRACQDARRQLFMLAAPKLEASPEERNSGHGLIYQSPGT